MASPISGAYLSAKINGQTVAGLMAWRAKESSAKLKGTTGANRGFTANKHGCQTLSVDLQIIQDITRTPYTPVSAGTVMTDLELFRDQDDATPAFSIPTFNVFDSDNGAEAEGSFTINASGENDGAYTKNDP